ncbi:Fic/DOC family [Legionella beliardensis]|uniref:Fic/DOC family n=1 Tax=Legionella beliardensis TaxID=91822 RepID=A0A378I210_9GAMM|nr:Fic family protein [Legionella beliardensis]STX29227.1 Fic/DOC family [Legionella beliardensis]
MAVKARLYKSIVSLGVRLAEGERQCASYYYSLCFELNFLFLNIKKNSQIFILDETGQQIIDYLLNNLNKQNLRFPPRFRAKEDFTFFYFHLLRNWLYFIKGNFEKANEALSVAKTFPEKIRCAETSHLETLVQKQIELQKAVQPIYRQQSISVEEVLEDKLNLLIKEYESNKAASLVDSSDEILARYFIDLEQQAQTDNPIDLWNQTEPGSVQAMIKLIRIMFNASAELSIDFIKEMHKLALEDVVLPQANRSFAITAGEFRQEPVRFGMLVDNTSLAGLYNVLDWVEKENINNNDASNYNIILSAYLDSFILEIYTNPAEIENKLLELINNYYLDITRASSSMHRIRELIKACATFSHYFSLIHPFSDGNLRLSQQLLNFLLAKNNLPLCILSDPALIEGSSPDELVDHICIGFKKFRQFVVKEQVTTKVQAPRMEKIEKDNVASLLSHSIFNYETTQKIAVKNCLVHDSPSFEQDKLIKNVSFS